MRVTKITYQIAKEVWKSLEQVEISSHDLIFFVFRFDNR